MAPLRPAWRSFWLAFYRPLNRNWQAPMTPSKIGRLGSGLGVFNFSAQDKKTKPVPLAGNRPKHHVSSSISLLSRFMTYR
jgi:hypothetical protein